MSRRRLIAERDVYLAHREGNRVLAIGDGILTPSARDAAARLGIQIVRDDAHAARAASSSPRPASTDRPGRTRRTSASRDAATVATTVATTGAQPAATGIPERTAGGAVRRVALGADHGGVAMKDALLAYLRERGAVVQDVGTFSAEAVDYPDFAVAVARAVASGAAEVGIMVDGAGIGSCMAANKVAGVRAAMCYDVTTAANAREHNHANVLTLGGTLIGTRLAQEIVRTFLDTPFGGGRHARRVEKIDALDAGVTRLPSANA